MEFWESIGSPKYVCAPMVDHSMLAFRLLVRQYNVDLAYTPMIHSAIFNQHPIHKKKSIIANWKEFENKYNDLNEENEVKIEYKWQKHPYENGPLFTQFCANDPQELLLAAKQVEEMCEAIDINLGCPQDIARRGHYGAFLLNDWSLIREMVSTLYNHLSIPISVKIRKLPSNNDTVSLARQIQDNGASVLCIHGRTKEKHNFESVDLDIIKLVKNNLNIPVIANGGVSCFDDVNNIFQYTNCDAVMSAEGLLSYPDLFNAHKNISPLTIARQLINISKSCDTPPKILKTHLFKILYGPLSIRTDIREQVAKMQKMNKFEQLSSVPELLMPSFSDSFDFYQLPNWYYRHRGKFIYNISNPDSQNKKMKIES